MSVAPTSRDANPLDTSPRTATLRWFAGTYLLILGMSFLILPRGPINPLYGLIWLRGPFFVLSGLVLLWLCTLRLSRRATILAHVLTAVPPLAVAVAYVYLDQYAPAATLLLLGVAIALSPFAPPRPRSSTWRPDALGLVLGLSLAANGIVLLVQSQPAVVPYGLQSEIAGLFLVFGLIVVCSHLAVPMPMLVRYAAHAGAGLSVIGLCVVFAVGVDPILWALNASGVLVGVAILALPWLSRRMVGLAFDTVRGRFAMGLFTGSLVPLLIAAPTTLVLGGSTDPVADSTRQIGFGVMLLLSIGAAVGGWWMARFLVDPLSRLMVGVGRIADGVRPVKLTSGGSREIEELAVAVETMADKLDDQMREIKGARDQHKTVAERLQRALQVTIGVFPGVELAHVYRSAGDLGEVGGDFYEVFHVSGGRIGILIGDVSGKGLDAAAQAVLMRTSLRAFTYYTQSPSEALARANALLLEAKTGFVTAFLGILDPVSGHLLCSSAGHPPAILVTDCGPSLMEGGGPVLGVFDDAVFAETGRHLDAGETLLLYTDGLTEARGDGEIFGESKLMSEVQSLAALAPSQLTQNLYDRALAFSAGTLGDDLALLALRLQPTSVKVSARQRESLSSSTQ